MTVMQRVVKPTTHKGKRAILKKEPKLIEDAKQTLCFKGKNTSQIVVDFMKDLYDLKKPDAQIMQKKNDILPFEDITPVEKFSVKYNAPLFMIALHNKKRPHNLVMGRMYEQTLLDMAEFGIENYKGLKSFKVPKIAEGIKPLLVFNGELFENNYELNRIKNLFVDMFQREPVEKIRLQGLEHVLSFTAIDNKILVRSYRILLKKSDCRIPRIELEEIGPRADLICRRTKLASEDLFKQACKKPKELKVKKKKNISVDKLGTTFGRVHVGAQNINSIQTRKMKGLKKTMAEKKAGSKRKNIENSDNDNLKKLKTNSDSAD
ncbi:ribosome production factor 2 homolog isoform X1 [Bombus vosnesenskii]|uniref:Ribosome production factor 2 homolog n=4 Tax=Pyrobombus TaxID=144703 RepID=A0A6J3K670_9HYME|nr:ribosome production factor 2 homolog isoform X1 [Bombus vancouverensis nearcticus]XP_033305220.1 ribosome production factor 2 homolog isoform X1 [Bombus bifarius]XP_033347981.1 ribosome production factor 2 homolog isoform X1 [Bombus vosnesenskii]XP_050486542.1 ribosome production factor 2 homolog [Bombus huntii]